MSKKSWRPEGWENPFDYTLCDGNVTVRANPDITKAYEAGADAMLEALRKDGLHVTTSLLTDDENDLGKAISDQVASTITTVEMVENKQILYGKNGTLVFISDNEEA
jgi:hypothetical protein